MRPFAFALPVLAALAGDLGAVEIGGEIRLGLQLGDHPDLVSGKLTLNAGGAEALNERLELSFGVEFENDSADEESDGFANDKSWIALGGAFGRVIAGEHADMAAWACGGTDVLFYGEAEACSLGHNTSPANALQYRGAAGDWRYGLAVDANGSGESSALLGVRYAGPGYEFGAQLVAAADNAVDDAGDPVFGGVAAGDRGAQLGGSYAFGDVVIALTLADNGAAGDSGGVDVGVQMPLAGNTLAVVVSHLQAGNIDSQDVLYSLALGEAAYAGVELNVSDALEDPLLTAFVGTTF